MGNLLGRKSSGMTEQLKPPAKMPDPDDPELVEAKRRQIMQTPKTGRAATILTGKGNGTGFDSFGSTKLGAGA